MRSKEKDVRSDVGLPQPHTPRQDPDICVNVIENEKIVRKINMELPSKVSGVFNCKNPRCITQTEHYVKPTFILADKKKGIYKCEYCDTLYLAGSENK